MTAVTASGPKEANDNNQQGHCHTQEVAMVAMTEQIVQDGFWFLLLVAGLAFMWFNFGHREHHESSQTRRKAG